MRNLNIYKKIFLTSVAALVQNDVCLSETQSVLTDNTKSEVINNLTTDYSKKLIMKFSSDGTASLNSHRSHRSHSSHRSHYSSRTSTSYSYTPSSYSTSLAYKNIGDRTLYKGLEGKDVTELINILVEKGFLGVTYKVQSGTKSKFTSIVKKAVQRFQQSRSISSDGVVGTDTVYHLKK
jgi:murein L,D-transpeptidase YcbB/YkuD